MRAREVAHKCPRLDPRSEEWVPVAVLGARMLGSAPPTEAAEEEKGGGGGSRLVSPSSPSSVVWKPNSRRPTYSTAAGCGDANGDDDHGVDGVEKNNAAGAAATTTTSFGTFVQQHDGLAACGEVGIVAAAAAVAPAAAARSAPPH